MRNFAVETFRDEVDIEIRKKRNELNFSCLAELTGQAPPFYNYLNPARIGRINGARHIISV